VTDILIFRSSKLFDADIVAAAFEENGIPFYRRQDAGGVERAMPAAPSEFFGVFWSIYVPAAVEADARSVLERLPVDPESDSKWEPSAADIRRWHYFLLLMTMAAAIIVYMKCFGH
jgi:hypothetical protein